MPYRCRCLWLRAQVWHRQRVAIGEAAGMLFHVPLITRLSAHFVFAPLRSTAEVLPTCTVPISLKAPWSGASPVLSGFWRRILAVGCYGRRNYPPPPPLPAPSAGTESINVSVFQVKPELGQNIVSHASFAARKTTRLILPSRFMKRSLFPVLYN